MLKPCRLLVPPFILETGCRLPPSYPPAVCLITSANNQCWGSARRIFRFRTSWLFDATSTSMWSGVSILRSFP